MDIGLTLSIDFYDIDTHKVYEEQSLSYLYIPGKFRNVDRYRSMQQ